MMYIDVLQMMEDRIELFVSSYIYRNKDAKIIEHNKYVIDSHRHRSPSFIVLSYSFVL
jgi:hypothetical protein